MKNGTSNDLRVETIGYSKRNWGNELDEVHRVHNKDVKVSEVFFSFETIVPLLHHFRKVTAIRTTIGSGLKRVVTGGVRKDIRQVDLPNFQKF